MTNRILFHVVLLPSWILCAILLPSSAWAEPDQNQTLDFINSYCVRNQVIVSDGILSTKLKGISFVPLEMSKKEFSATRTLKLTLSKVVANSIQNAQISGNFGRYGEPNYKYDSSFGYILTCKTQDCATYTENLDGTGNLLYANRAGFHEKPLDNPNIFREQCLKAFSHLAQLNGATENSDLFK